MKNAKDGYFWIPAATNYNSFGGLGIYVKYKGGQKNRILVKEHTSKFCHVVCPDRELIFTWDNHSDSAFYPAGMGFNEFVSYNMLDDSVCNKLGFEYVMTNYVHISNKSGVALNRTKGAPEGTKLTILSDSGGFQYSTGVTDLINPIDLVNFYNKNVDAGMALDLPLSVSDIELTKRAAKIQAKNLDIILQHKAPHVDILNIVQGVTNEEAAVYRDIVEREGTPRLALGGVYRRPLIPGIDYVLDSIFTSKHRYSQYHILGVFGVSHVASLIAISNLGDNAPHVTSDSTSHIQSAMSHSYHHHYDFYKSHKRIAFGLKGTSPNVHNQLPCQCSVCSIVRYQDILGFLPGQMIMNLAAIHNAHVFNKYTRMMQDAIQSLSYHDFVALVVKHIAHNNSDEAKNARIALDYVNRYINDTPKAAKHKYKEFLSNKSGAGKVKRVFADGNLNVGLFGVGQNVSNTLSKPKEIARLHKILDDMEHQINNLNKISNLESKTKFVKGASTSKSKLKRKAMAV